LDETEALRVPQPISVNDTLKQPLFLRLIDSPFGLTHKHATPHIRFRLVIVGVVSKYPMLSANPQNKNKGKSFPYLILSKTAG
jgi:hypothetical protein